MRRAIFKLLMRFGFLIGQPAVRPRHQLKSRTPEQFLLNKNILIVSVSCNFLGTLSPNKLFFAIILAPFAIGLCADPLRFSLSRYCSRDPD